MIHLLMSHPGTHAVAHAAPVAALPLIFRRAIAAVRRKPAAPEVQTTASGAGATGGSDWSDKVPPQPPYITWDYEALRAMDELVAQGERPACWLPLADKLWPPAEPVMRNRMLSEVRAEQDVKPTFTPARPTFTPSSAMNTGEFAALDAKVDAVLRPVNGQARPDQPRRQPVYGEAPQLKVERDAARAAGERARACYEPASPRLLDQVLAGLRKL